MKTETNSRGLQISFDEASHIYESIGETPCKRYASVTSVVKKYFPPFDRITAAKRVSDRDGRSPDEIMEEWDIERDRASTVGTRFHQTMEAALLGTKPPHQPNDETEKEMFRRGWQYCQELKKREQIIGVEQILFDERYLIAGQADLITERDGTVIIRDWKTCKAIKHDQREKAGYPLHTCWDNNHTHYTLQLGLYRQLAEDSGWFEDQKMARAMIDGNIVLLLVHVDYQSKTLTEIEMPWMGCDVNRIINVELIGRLGKERIR